VSDARSIYREAFKHFANGRVEEAIAGYKRAIEVDPAFELAWNGLSMAYRKLGDLDAAIEAAQKLVELAPDDPLSHTNLSIVLMNKGLIPEAEDAKARAMQLQARQEG
jgi:tetratricopeptide (TPR) repeat protein